MTRNTVRRVEIATPIYDRYIQKRLRQMFQIMLMDDEKGKEQGRPINESFPTAFPPFFSIDSYCRLVSIRCIIIFQMNTEDSLCGRGAYG